MSHPPVHKFQNLYKSVRNNPQQHLDENKDILNQVLTELDL